MLLGLLLVSLVVYGVVFTFYVYKAMQEQNK
jgi:hypothetical protein